MNWLHRLFASLSIDCYGALAIEDVHIINERLLMKEDFEARSVLLFLVPYYAGETVNLSRYAAARDYHIILKEITDRLIAGIKERYPDTEFHICGFCEPEYEGRLEEITRDNTVIYHGLVKDTRPFLQTAHCTVLPSYHEGMANVLLESAACGRPVIATDVPGCRETYDDGVTGLSCKPASPEDLIRAMERFLALSPDERKSMGLAGREKVVSQFDREIVIRAYLAELESL